MESAKAPALFCFVLPSTMVVRMGYIGNTHGVKASPKPSARKRSTMPARPRFFIASVSSLMRLKPSFAESSDSPAAAGSVLPAPAAGCSDAASLPVFSRGSFLVTGG